MATDTYFVDRTPEINDLPHLQTTLQAIIDFATHGVAALDVVQVLKIPKNFMVRNVKVKVLTAEGATCTAKVGDGTDDDGWDASTNLNATAGTITGGAVGTDALCVALGTQYTSADTIDLTMANAAATAKILVVAEGQQYAA